MVRGDLLNQGLLLGLLFHLRWQSVLPKLHDLLGALALLKFVNLAIQMMAMQMTGLQMTGLQMLVPIQIVDHSSSDLEELELS
jgi:hypothetical protein